MGKPWSKLKSSIMNIVDPKAKVDIHQTVYRMASQRGSTDLPRYYLTVEKEIVFDYPKNYLSYPTYSYTYKGQTKTYSLEETYPHQNHMSMISNLIREYVDTPVAEVLNKEFDDPFNLTDYLKAADRRIGREKLISWAVNRELGVRKIIALRFNQESHFIPLQNLKKGDK